MLFYLLLTSEIHIQLIDQSVEAVSEPFIANFIMFCLRLIFTECRDHPGWKLFLWAITIYFNIKNYLLEKSMVAIK